MNLTHKSDQQQTADSVYRKFQRVILAVCIILAPLALSSWFVLCPQYGVPRCPETTDAALAAFRAVNPLLMQWFFFVTLVVAYLYPFSYLGLGLAAMKRSPWLATLGIACGLIGSLLWTAIVEQVILINGTAHMEGSAISLALLNQTTSTLPIIVLFLGWVIGHLLGYVLLGIALGRARVIPLGCQSPHRQRLLPGNLLPHAPGHTPGLLGPFGCKFLNSTSTLQQRASSASHIFRPLRILQQEKGYQGHH